MQQHVLPENSTIGTGAGKQLHCNRGQIKRIVLRLCVNEVQWSERGNHQSCSSLKILNCFVYSLFIQVQGYELVKNK
ncbi:unnamed protein product [Spodoptera littoralis]|uniref:Uncharacterized protein n=1 Tax=Spodoptera littoralis TaxID=7109 RepID=A0A9P0I7K0_SPOLI|nr:unnamed protein product [Spodoptera littoralis]